MRSLGQFLREFSDLYLLTQREHEILCILANQDTSGFAIAEKTQTSPNTIKNHFLHLFEKTGTKSKSELLAKFLNFIHQKQSIFQNTKLAPTLFVVDDEQEIVEILADNLEGQGFRVYKFTNSEKVKANLSSILPEIIISDYNMPGLNGLEMLKLIREHYTLFPGFIFISANASELQKHDLSQLGVSAILDKPIQFERLYDIIMNYYLNSVEERNRYLRVTAQIEVEFENYRLRTENISYGGVFIALEKEQEDLLQSKFVENKNLSFVLKMSGKDSPISLKGKIVWKRRAQGADSPAGVGVKFTQIPCDDQLSILEFIKLKKLFTLLPKS